MTGLKELPSELPLNIASRIEGLTRQLDLCSLSLACRKLRLIAQEALFRNPILYLPERRDQPTSALYLARSLIERPDLARLVKHFTIPFSFSSPLLPWVEMYNKSILDVGISKNLNSVAEMCLETMKMQLGGQGELIKDYYVGVRTGYVGLCLTLVPNLKSLNLPVYNSEIRSAPEFRVNLSFVCNLGPEILKSLPAFGYLKSLSINCPLPWFIVALPSLATLHFGLSQTSNTITDFPETCASLGIRSLTVDLDVCASTLSSLTRITFSYVARLMYHRTQLEALSLRITQQRRTRFFFHPSFTVMMNHIPPHEKLETLKIDMVNIFSQNQRKFRYLASLRQFPNLRRIVLPQEALVDDRKFRFTKLPSGVQEVGVIDATQALKFWTLRVYAERSEFPELSKIVFWCDELSCPLEDDSFYARQLAVQLDGEVDMAMDVNLPETIKLSEHSWDEIQRLGIVVENRGIRKRHGWR